MFHQLFNMRQDQNPAFSNFSKLSDHEAFTGTRWEDNDSRITLFLKISDSVVHCFLLVMP